MSNCDGHRWLVVPASEIYPGFWFKTWRGGDIGPTVVLVVVILIHPQDNLLIYSTISTMSTRLPSQMLYQRRLPSLSTRYRLATHLSTASRPSPPRLPKEEQERFEHLQRTSSSSSSSSNISPTGGRLPLSSPTTTTTIKSSSSSSSKDEENIHPDARRGAPPEFEGDVNPETGEVGGPKNEPLRWGAQGEWTYNGRATDF